MVQQLKSYYLDKSLDIFKQSLDTMKQRIQQQNQKYNQFIQLQRHVYLESKAIFMHNFIFPFKNVKNDLVYINFLPRFDMDVYQNSGHIQTVYNQPQNFILPVQIQPNKHQIVTRFVKDNNFVNQFMKISVYRKDEKGMKLTVQSFNPFVLKTQKQSVQNIQCLGMQSIENQIFNNYLNYVEKCETEIDREFQIEVESQNVILVKSKNYILEFKLEWLDKQQIKMDLFDGWIYDCVLQDFIESSQKIRLYQLVYQIDRFLGYN